VKITGVSSITRDWPACVKFHSKMGTEVVGTLTHADAPQRGNDPHSAPRPACVSHALQ
jgi:hypothetical protein